MESAAVIWRWQQGYELIEEYTGVPHLRKMEVALNAPLRVSRTEQGSCSINYSLRIGCGPVSPAPGPGPGSVI